MPDNRELKDSGIFGETASYKLVDKGHEIEVIDSSNWAGDSVGTIRTHWNGNPEFTNRDGVKSEIRSGVLDGTLPSGEAIRDINRARSAARVSAPSGGNANGPDMFSWGNGPSVDYDPSDNQGPDSLLSEVLGVLFGSPLQMLVTLVVGFFLLQVPMLMIFHVATWGDTIAQIPTNLPLALKELVDSLAGIFSGF